jgi:hypothetical protein
VALLAIGLAAVGVAMQARGLWVAWRGVGYGAGVVTPLTLVLLALYSVPKRAVRLWSRRRERSLRNEDPAPVRSLVRPQLTFHLVVGLLGLGIAPWHAGFSFGGGSGGALLLAFVICGAVGVAAAVSYALLPRRLSRIERSALLPEDFATARRELLDQLYGGVTGRSEVVKRLFEKVLVPYLRTPLGWVVLLISGRRLSDEERALRVRIDDVLQGRGQDRLAGLDMLIRLVVELRALTAQRALTFAMRGWLPLHIVSASACLALLVIHLIEVLR